MRAETAPKIVQIAVGRPNIPPKRHARRNYRLWCKSKLASKMPISTAESRRNYAINMSNHQKFPNHVWVKTFAIKERLGPRGRHPVIKRLQEIGRHKNRNMSKTSNRKILRKLFFRELQN
jgi:hypothetical protein